MKKYTLILSLLMLVTVSAFGQNNPAKKIWSKPSAFLPTEEVTIYVDLDGTSLSPEDDVYLWGWSNGFNAENGEWGNSSEERKWAFISGTTVAYKTFSNIQAVWPDATAGSDFNFLMKTKDGSKQTADLTFTVPDLSVANDQLITTIPAEFTGNDNVSILVNAALTYGDKGENQGQLQGADIVAAEAGVNNWAKVVGSSEDKAELTDLGNNIWRLDIVPAEYFEFEEVITEINILFNNDGDWGLSGRDEGGENFLLEVKEPPSTKVRLPFSNFPSSFTAKDVVAFYFDTNLIGGSFQYVTSLSVESVEFNDIVVDLSGKAIKTSHLGQGYFRMMIMPDSFLNLTDDQIANGGTIKVIIKAEDGTTAPFEFEMEACQ